MLALNSLGPQQTSHRELDSVVIPHVTARSPQPWVHKPLPAVRTLGA